MDLRTQEQRGASTPRSRVWRFPSASAAGETKPFVVKPPFLNQYSPPTRSLELALHRGWLVSPPLDCVVTTLTPGGWGRDP